MGYDARNSSPECFLIKVVSYMCLINDNVSKDTDCDNSSSDLLVCVLMCVLITVGSNMEFDARNSSSDLPMYIAYIVGSLGFRL